MPESSKGSEEYQRQLDYALIELEIAISSFAKLIKDCQREDLYSARDRARRDLWALTNAVNKFDPRA